MFSCIYFLSWYLMNIFDGKCVINLGDILNQENFTRILMQMLHSDWVSHHALSTIIICQLFSLRHDWFKHIMWLNIPKLKLGNNREHYPIVKTVRCEKYLKIRSTIASIRLRKDFRMFVLDHYLLLKSHSFPWAYSSSLNSIRFFLI